MRTLKDSRNNTHASQISQQLPEVEIVSVSASGATQLRRAAELQLRRVAAYIHILFLAQKFRNSFHLFPVPSSIQLERKKGKKNRRKDHLVSFKTHIVDKK
ncbi:hypothetical protein CEXT_67641 [Caerostris extrusa]|uniref:Uncharacterized protein n=1 Tax=Caerostris extrusa TaxID=172846 RepID=A0AAV4MKL7_CAEEX|nr:hypothetical protein CEXT_67641 [Caerostris extrusa]